MSTDLLDHLTESDLPRRMGRYELQSILGEGGMARVFGAELFGPAGFRKQVALKVVKSEMIGEADGGEAEAFIREARLGGLLKHPSIVDVYELGEAEGQLFIAMEWIRGVTLSDIIRSGLIPPPAVVLEIAVGIASGLDSAHSLVAEGLKAGLVHRDLKPSNVLVSWDGAVKVMDFGIATTVHGESAVEGQAFSEGRGTPSYMSPEQFLCEPLDGRSDQYALGLVLIELVLGEFLPRKVLYNHLVGGGDRSVSVIDAQSVLEVETTVPGLGSIVARCLSPFAAQRYASVGLLLGELEALRAKVGLDSTLRDWLVTMLGSSQEQGPPGSPRTTLPAALMDADTAVLEAPSAVGPQRPRTNVGPSLDEFVGRVHEHDTLSSHFADGSRLVTLKGMGGTGKTRLARQFARSVVDELAGGVWFVDLTEARSLQELVNATAMTIEVPLRGDNIEQMIELVGHAISGHGPALFVFDNVEQVVADAATSLRRWMAMAPEALFLVTSREALQLAGEHVYSLQPLTEEEGVALFELRAKAAGAQWSPTPESIEAVKGIVHQLDCLPLAIELAAARARMMPPHQLLARLTDRFKLLRGGRRGVSDRQASLHGLIDWSWQLLEPWEKTALAQLSVFQGGFFMDSAEEVLDLSEWPEAPWSMDVVGSLLDKSLIHCREVYGQPRFGMYASIQAYAKHVLDADAATVSMRHAQHYARLYEDAFARERDGANHLKPLSHLSLERDNLLASVNCALVHEAHDVAAQCAMAASDSYKAHGPYSDGIGLLKRIPIDSLQVANSARIHRKLGLLLQHIRGHSDAAVQHFETAVEQFDSVGERKNSALAMMNLAAFIVRKRQFDTAQAYYDDALAEFQAMNSRSLEGVCLGNMATLYRRMGRHTDAIDAMTQALSIARELNDQESQCIQLANLSNAYNDGGQFERAKACAEEALVFARDVGNRYFESVVLGTIAGSLERDKRWEEAIGFRQESLRISREMGNRLTEAICLGNMGTNFTHQDDLDAAEKHLRESLTITDGEWEVPNGFFGASLAVVRAKKGDLVEARDLFSRAEALLKGAHMSGYVESLCKQAKVEHQAGEGEQALRALRKAEAAVAALDLGPDAEMSVWIVDAQQTLEADAGSA